MHLLITYIHIIFVIFFTSYILIDRIYIRNFTEKTNRETFYKKSRLPLLINSLIITCSGLYLLLHTDFNIIVLFKIIAALLLFYGFFNCPFFMKKEECEIRRFMYRFGVVILLIITIVLGLYI